MSGSFEELNQEAREIWEKNAAFWDQQMGDGNEFQRTLLAPALERLLHLKPSELVLDVGCGNGVFARRLAQLGIKVIAIDFSSAFIELAIARSKNASGFDGIDYRVVDATDEQALLALGIGRFDAIVCNMAIMDMATIDPLMRAVPQLLKKPHGRFVFSVMHPCFNNSATQLMSEQEFATDFVTVYSVKVKKYLHLCPELGGGMVGQPEPHYYFHRPLHVLLNAGFGSGLVVDGFEEPAFENSTKPRVHLSWKNLSQIPPVVVVRMRSHSSAVMLTHSHSQASQLLEAYPADEDIKGVFSRTSAWNV